MTWIIAYAAVWLAMQGAALILTALALRQSRAVPPGQSAPAISVIKPVRGLDTDAGENLRSWLDQDYEGPLEIIFSLQDPQDPALPLLRELERGAGHVRICVNPIREGFGGKTSNLHYGLEQARHGLIVLSDADMAAPPDTLRRIVGAMEQGADVVACLPCHVNARNLWAQLYAQVWNGVILAVWGGSMVLRRPAGLPGGTVALRRGDLDRIGGIAGIADFLAEDIALGQAALRDGLRLGMGPPLRSPVGTMDFPALWDKLRRGALAVIHANPHNRVVTVFLLALAYAYLPLSAWAVMRLDWVAMAVMLGLLAGYGLIQGLRDALVTGRFRFAWQAPLTDVINLAALATALTHPQLRWGGRRYRMLRGGRMRPVD